jgi:uncharacterized protein (DUF362 family)
MAYDALKRVFVDDVKGKRILLKPNAGRKGKVRTAICTNPEVIRGVIRFLKEKEAGEILVGDGALWGVNVWEAMETAGISAVCQEEQVKPVNLDEAPPVVKQIAGGVMVEQLKFSSLAFEADMVISIPVIKTHMYTGATLSIKNMKGCLYKMEKTKLHRINKPCPDKNKGRCLDYGIADMATVLLPDYVVADGTVCMEGFGPSVGDPVNLDLVVAGKDPTATDYVCIQLMGMKHDAVPHVTLVQERMGTAGIHDIEVDPPDFIKYAKTFATADMTRLKNSYPNISVIEKGACSACSATIMAFIKTHGHKFDQEYHFTLATGKDLSEDDLARENLVLVGNCAGDCVKGSGSGFCKGCPPIGSGILAYMNRESEDDYEKAIR